MRRVRGHRFWILVGAVALTSAGIVARLAQYQVVECKELRARAERQYKKQIEIPATRGAILDRNGRELAVSLDTQALFAHPWRIEDPDGTAKLLAPIVGRSRHEIAKTLRSEKPFVWIDRFLEPTQVESVLDSGLPVGNSEPLGLLPSSKRYYPHGRLGVHVVGFANIDGEGVEGIEQRMDERLRGNPSEYVVLQDGRSGRLRQVASSVGTAPDDVVLTLDLVLQRIAEREIEAAVRETGARAASVVLLEPASGQLLALANWPAADANRYGEASAEARVNRAAVHQFEPGSTFKSVPMAAALELGRVRPEQRFFCENGVYRSGGRTIRDVSPQGSLSAREVIEKSSNICMAKIADRIAPEDFADTIRRFGFGAETGVELPGELEGAVPAVDRWSGYTRASLSFGQEIGVTALQMATAMGVVANDGIRIPPRVVLGTIDPSGGFHRSPGSQPTRVVGSRSAREVSTMLEGVVARGTGRGAAIAGYRLAGKSGTAQKAVDGGYSDTEYFASFVGFGPVTTPRLVGLVVLDTPDYGRHRGGRAAAPVFGRIMSEALAYLRIPEDDEPLSVARLPAPPRAEAQPAVKVTSPAPPPKSQATGIVPDLDGLALREAVARLAAHGYGSVIEGQGVVIAQHPAAGTRLAPGEPCRLRLGRGSTR
jgi:cell division protein FtsI (penicillin-binding protein 3)